LNPNIPQDEIISPLIELTHSMSQRLDGNVQSILNMLLQGHEIVRDNRCSLCGERGHIRTDTYTVSGPILALNIQNAPNLAETLEFPSVLNVGNKRYRIVSRIKKASNEGGHFTTYSRYAEHTLFHDSNQNEGVSRITRDQALAGKHRLNAVVFYVLDN
jgi:hypothetical protein